MKRIKIDRLDKGINESLEADRIPDNALVSAIDLEYNNSDTPEKRKDVAVFLDSLAWDLDIANFYVWYAPKMPSGADADIVYFIFTTDNELWITYEKDGGWHSEQIEITDIDYSNVDAEDITFVNANNKIIIVDDVNESHFVMFDKDGVLVSGKLEYPAPQNKITFEQMTSWEDSRFETTMTEAYLGDCGLYQYLYCYADRFGNLSNPSPISDTYYIDYFEYDDDGDDDRKVDRIQLFNMALPDGLDKETKSNIEEFYIYRRNVRYSEGADTGAFELVKVIDIVNKPQAENDPNNESINSTTDTEFTTEGEVPSYGNLAPVAVDAVATAGVIVAVGTKTKDPTLWDFKYKCPINISNENTQNYIDANIIIKIDKDFLEDKDGNKPFNPNDYIGDDPNKMSNRDKLILFDSDFTTPLNTIAYDFDGDAFYLIVKIPQLSSGEKTIYFCFTPQADFDDYEGIPEKYMDINVGIDYGAFMVAGFAGWYRQRNFYGEKVKENSIVCSDFEFLKDGDVINKANLEYNGEMNDCSVVDDIAMISFLDGYGGYYVYPTPFPIGTKAISFDNYETSQLKYDFSDGTIFPESGYMKLIVDFGELPEYGETYDICKIMLTNGNYIRIYWEYAPGDSGYVWGMRATIHTDSGTYGKNLSEFGNHSGNVIFSWDTNSKKISYFLVGRENGVLLNTSEHTLPSFISGEIDYVKFGRDDGSAVSCSLPSGSILDQVQMIGATYLPAGTNFGKSNAMNIASFMPYFETELIGYDMHADELNQHITFDEIEQIEYNNTNRAMWTPVNGLSFNLANYKDIDEQSKRVIVAPYFLQDTYGNSAIIFTRNNIIRFLLDGTPEEWTLRTDNFITEFKQYGLLSKNSLGRYGESLFWHSEVGFMRWDKGGIKIISKNRLDVPIKENIVGFPVPLRNQYIFHDNENNKSWVYHIDTDVWTIFNGLDIEQVQILSGGSDDNNYNLFLTSNNDINYYPTTDYIGGTSGVTTKSYSFDNIDFVRFRIDYVGDECDVTTFVTNPDEQISQSFSNIDRMEWNYLDNGNWGENIRFVIGGFDKLKKIEFDINRR